MTDLVIVGAGGHGAVVAEAAKLSSHWTSISFVDDSLKVGDEVVGCPVLGKTQSIFEQVKNDSDLFVAVGDNTSREEIFGRVETAGGRLATIVHPSATISDYSEISPGVVVCAGAVINARARVGVGAIVNTGATIDHDCVVGDFVHISPGAHLAGNVSVGVRSWIGIGASVKEGVTIGTDCTVGAGAAVVSDVESGAKVVGVPAKSIAT